MASTTTALTISVRQLHARTGHFLRKASKNLRVVITDNGKPIVELKPLTSATEHALVPFSQRKLLPAFKKSRDAGAYTPRPGERDITDIISEDRDRTY